MKNSQITADGFFLRAFDAAIETVYRELASSGVPEDAIWTAFRRATAVLTDLSTDVDTERNSPRRTRAAKPPAVELHSVNLA